MPRRSVPLPRSSASPLARRGWLPAALVVLAACGPPADQPEAPRGAERPLSRAELAAAEYPVDDAPGATVRLIDGVYPPVGRPVPPDGSTVRLADLIATGRRGDGVAIAAVVVETSGGGTGSFTWLYLMGRVSDTVRVLAATFLGDRVEVAGLQLAGDTVVVKLVTQGPDDPMCCPTLQLMKRFVQAGGELRAVSGKQ